MSGNNVDYWKHCVWSLINNKSTEVILELTSIQSIFEEKFIRICVTRAGSMLRMISYTSIDN